MFHPDSISQLLPLSLPSDTTDEETKLVASKNGIFGSGDAFLIVAANVVSKVDSLGDASFDSGPVGLVSQSSHVDVESDPRSAERELVVKGGNLTSSSDLAPYSPCSSSGYLREVGVIIDKGVGNSLPTLVGMELRCAVGNSQLFSSLWPRLDVDLFNMYEAMVCTPLKCCPLLCLGKIFAQG